MTECPKCSDKIRRLEYLAASKTPAEITESELKRLQEVATGSRTWVDAKEHSKLKLELNKLSRQLKEALDSGYKKGYSQGFHDCEVRNDP